MAEDNKTVSKIKKMSEKEIRQNTLYNLNLIRREMGEIKGYVRFMALLVLLGVILAVIIGIWLGMNIVS